MYPSLDGHDYQRDPATGLILRHDERFEPWMDLAYSVKAGISSLEGEDRSDAVANLCQVELHRLIEGMVNFMPLNRVKFSWGKARALRDRIARVGWCLRELEQPDRNCPETELACQRCEQAAGKDSITRYELASVVSGVYRSITRDRSVSRAVSQITSQPLTPNHLSGDGKRGVAALHRLANGVLREHAMDYFVHGSYASLDTSGYSDLDTLVILKAEVVSDVKRLMLAASDLRSALKNLYRTDPLQHHGHFVIAEQDLWAYPETFFPLVLFEHAVSLRDDRQGATLEVTPRDCRLETHAAVWGICYEIRKRFLQSRPPRSAFEKKLFLSWLMLLPAMYLQAKGQACYKRDSFGLARGDFDGAVWQASVEMASQKRAVWTNPWHWRLAMRAGMTCGLDPVLVSAGYSKISGAISSTRDSKAWLAPSARFAEQILERLRNE